MTSIKHPPQHSTPPLSVPRLSIPRLSIPGLSIPRLSIIVPMLNEALQIEPLLSQLQIYQDKGCEIILVDGGSSDGSVEIASKQFKVITSPAGRAQQMNAGARAAQANHLLFLHADTRLPADADRLICGSLEPVGSLEPIDSLEHSDSAEPSSSQWGRFDIAINGNSKMLPVISWFMNKRSRITGIATGDQAIFVTRAAFQSVSGFPDQPLMEDIEISRQLRKLSPPVCLTQKVTTSGRRWDENGSWRTILLMWRLRWAYWRGTPTERLASIYR